jgi:hypothetical protein
VYRHMGGIGDQLPRRIKQGAGEIQPFAHVDAGGGVFKTSPICCAKAMKREA